MRNRESCTKRYILSRQKSVIRVTLIGQKYLEDIWKSSKYLFVSKINIDQKNQWTIDEHKFFNNGELSLIVKYLKQK